VVVPCGASVIGKYNILLRLRRIVIGGDDFELTGFKPLIFHPEMLALNLLVGLGKPIG